MGSNRRSEREQRSSPLRLLMLLVLCIAQGATAQTAGVRLGGLFQHTTIKFGRFAAFVMAVQEINNSTELLPYTELRCCHAPLPHTRLTRP